jgi:hypothetical protein
MFASRIFPRFGSRLQADPVYILEMFVMRLIGRPGANPYPVTAIVLAPTPI